MPTGYFCISAVSTYREGGDFEECKFGNLELVPREATTVREALTELGLVELFTTAGGELAHEQLRQELERWRREYDPDDPPEEDATLVLYCTGHGFVDQVAGWRLVPPEAGHVDVNRWTKPAELLQPILRRADVSQVLLVLDACFAQDGAREALTTALEVAPLVGSKTDVWVVAAARRSDEAQQMKFVSAFVDSLGHHAARDLSAPYLDPSTVTDTAATVLRRRRAAQAPWVAAGYRAGGCRALPNPRFMPPDPPGWIETRWSAHARGVPAATDPGWYFTGRSEVLRCLANCLNGEDRSDTRPVLLTGGAGTGKTAILARLLTTATVRLRRKLPPVARRGYLPTGDIPFTALDVAGLDVGDAAAELARVLGLPALDALAVVAALAGREEPYPLIVDNVDQAADPVAMVNQFLQPLSAVASVRLVAAVRSGTVAAFSGFRHVDLQGSGDDAEPAIEAYVRERLTYGLVSSGGMVASELASTVRDLAAACVGNFSAAVVSVETLLRQLGARHSMKDARAEALRLAHRRLDGLCRSAMGHADDGSGSRYVDDLAACLSAACSYSPDGWLSTALWACVARRTNGLPYTAEDVEARAKPALAFLKCQPAPDGASLWRPQYGHVVRGNDPTRHEVVQHLLDEARQAYGPQWTGAQPGVLAILLGAAADEDGRFATLLDDAALLLAAPTPLVTRALRAIQSHADGRRRIATWAGVPAEGEPRERAFLLRLSAARNGLTRLACSAPDKGRHASLPLAWATRVTSLGERSPVTRLSLAAGSDGLCLVTAHDDGSLTWWDGADGRQLRAWPDPRPRNQSEGTAVLSLTAAQTADGPLTAVVTGDRQVRRWGPDDAVSSFPLPGFATLAATHASGLVALVHGPVITVVDVMSAAGERRCILPDRVVGADIAGPPKDPVLWLVDAGGRVWRWNLLAGSRQPSAVSLCPSPLLLACSHEGAATVVVDVHGRLVLPAFPRAAERPRATPDVRSAALNEDWLVLGGGPHRHSGWLEVHQAAASTSGTRWPLDGMPVGLGIAGDVLVAATPDGLLSIRLPTGGGS
jgi:hypothetical protein